VPLPVDDAVVAELDFLGDGGIVNEELKVILGRKKRPKPNRPKAVLWDVCYRRLFLLILL
jgi:hypothetical protein